MSETQTTERDASTTSQDAFQRTSFARCPNGHLVINGPRPKDYMPEPDGHGNHRECYHCGECEENTTYVSTRRGQDVADADWDFDPLSWFCVIAETPKPTSEGDEAILALASDQAHAMQVALEHADVNSNISQVTARKLPDGDDDIHGMGKRLLHGMFQAAVTPVGDVITPDHITEITRDYSDEPAYHLK